MRTITFLLLRGLPGSGKSTYASTLVAEGWKRINKDTLRDMVDNGRFSPEGEHALNEAVYTMAHQYLLDGFNVVSDNMNLDIFHWKKARRMVDDLNRIRIKDPNIQFRLEGKDFDTPIATCIARDACRIKPVTAEVIQKIHNKFMPGGVMSDISEHLRFE